MKNLANKYNFEQHNNQDYFDFFDELRHQAYIDLGGFVTMLINEYRDMSLSKAKEIFAEWCSLRKISYTR